MPLFSLGSPRHWPAHVHVLCTTRAGGISAPPWDSFNLGTHVGDSPAAVQANRARLQSLLGKDVHPVYLQQVHGTQVQMLDAHTPNGLPADASTTRHAGIACTVMMADCLPVLFANRSGTQVAAAHAGWRGLAAGVLETTLACFDRADEVLAWLGPCIGPSAFAVGAEVRKAFCQTNSAATAHFQPLNKGQWRADLAALARQRLHAAGVAHISGNDSTPAWCTVGNPSRFFSHRRDSPLFGSSGRMAACIWIAAG